MTGSFAISFPGQGGDWRAGVDTLVANAESPLVRALADRLGTSAWAELDELDTRNAQPVIYVAGLVGPAATRAEADIALGHSMGEITAAAWAGAIDATVGLDLVVARAALGHRTHDDRPGAMAAFMRWDAARVEWLRRNVLAALPGVLEVAVVNSPTQHVLSGDAALVELAVERCNADGGVARQLPIGGAYHSPLMVPALDGYGRLVNQAVTEAPRVGVVSSTTGKVAETAEAVADSLVRGLVLPVDWPAVISRAADMGITHAIDAGPGDTLRRLARFLPAVTFEGS